MRMPHHSPRNGSEQVNAIITLQAQGLSQAMIGKGARAAGFAHFIRKSRIASANNAAMCHITNLHDLRSIVIPFQDKTNSFNVFFTSWHLKLKL
jgi:hypothetical protein